MRQEAISVGSRRVAGLSRGKKTLRPAERKILLGGNVIRLRAVVRVI